MSLFSKIKQAAANPIQIIADILDGIDAEKLAKAEERINSLEERVKEIENGQEKSEESKS